VALLGGCATSREWHVVTKTDATAPGLHVVASGQQPHRVAIDLGNAAYVTVLYVQPGRGAAVLYPADTTTRATRLAAGSHQLDIGWPRSAQRLVSADESVRMPLDSLALKRRSQTTAPVLLLGKRAFDRSERSAFATGYLLVVASATASEPARVRERLAGVTLPIDAPAALRAATALVGTGAPSGFRAVAAPHEALRDP
jgi:hypothetical protein